MSILKKIVLPLFILFNVSAFATVPLITFVCTGNTGRSPMAEALAKDYIAKNLLAINVQSRGVSVDRGEITPEAGTVTVLKERGIDISSHRAAQLTEEDIVRSHYLLTMTQSHKDKILAKYPQAVDKVFTLAEFATGEHTDLSDPYQLPLDAYHRVERQLDEFLPLALDKITDE
ncbi:low molecular weight protein arginine phosphatase [Orbus sturtevantii]|uniref:low molecular weight protein arginine phosphatase n=1 Tax=Orbus sturtevantii TaxID=3074109 RepID=UPI00370D9B2B